MTDKRNLRLFCPTHEAAFDAAENPKILCEITGHALSTDFPNHEFWEYCCNCRIFSPANLDKGEKARKVCYGCGNNISKRFACENCKVFSFECDSQAKGKSYFISAEQGIEPNCPGCRSERQNGVLIWHECEDIDAGFFTARETCPFCLNKTSVKKPKQKNKSRVDSEVICPQCTAKNPASSLFCGECRHRLRKDAAVNTGTNENKSRLLGSLCPNCSMPMPPDAGFCGECGQAVKKEAALPPPPPPKRNNRLKTESGRESFDTNVLDYDYAAWANQSRQTGVPPNLDKANAPTDYRNSNLTEMNSTSSRKIEKIGLPEYILSALPYLPFYIGFAASVLELFLIPRNEAKVRFHAAQSLAAHLSFLVIMILSSMANIPSLLSFCNIIFIITMSIWTIKAFQKKPVNLIFLNFLTKWLDKKASPQQ